MPPEDFVTNESQGDIFIREIKRLPAWCARWWGVQRFEIDVDTRLVAEKLVSG
jgi:hypothetical protein